jgi:hypothetical protein
LAAFCLRPGLWEDGWEWGLAGHEHGLFAGHFHGNTMALRGLLDLAVATDDGRLKGLVRDGYEHARRVGVPRLGWFPAWITPERFGRPAWLKTVSETCGIADLVALAIGLSDAGLGDYWDDVDHYVRNQFVEQQLVDASRLEAVIQAAQATQPRQEVSPALGATEKVLERSLGGFSMGTPAALDSVSAYGCCTGNGSLGLYDAWEGIVRFQAGLATVNLLLNRASPWVDVDSGLPYEGKVRFTNKQANRLAVRVPGWVRREEVRLTVEATTVSPWWVGRYLLLGEVKPGQRVEVTFPVPWQQARYTVHGQEFTLDFRGSTVVGITPQDPSPLHYPLYQRESLKGEEVPMKKVSRFVCTE